MQTSYGRHDHRGRHRYCSRLSARQHGRDHRVLVGRARESDGSSVGRASTAANSAEKSDQPLAVAGHCEPIIFWTTGEV